VNRGAWLLRGVCSKTSRACVVGYSTAQTTSLVISLPHRATFIPFDLFGVSFAAREPVLFLLRASQIYVNAVNAKVPTMTQKAEVSVETMTSDPKSPWK